MTKIYEKIDINKKYDLPSKVIFCKRCVISNQRPRIVFDSEGVCNACRYFEYKKTIDWEKRENELIKILDKHRSSDHSYDCIVPSSGGKDSATVAHKLKHEYNMNPLTVTWSPLMYTDIGWKNLKNFNDSGFDIILGMPKGDISKKLCRDALIEMGDPFQGFIYGQVLFPVNIAVKYGISLIFRGENAEAEYGGLQSFWDKRSINSSEMKKTYFSKYEVNFWLERGYMERDLNMYFPPDEKKIEELNVESFFYGYFKNWSNHSNFYYASENTGFKPNTKRTEGTYTKYQSLDDKIDGFFHYTSYVKFGFGRAMSDSCEEVRHGHITKDEGKALIKKFDGEYPQRYENEFYDYISMKKEEFLELCDKFRPDHIWQKKSNQWILKKSL